MTKDEALRMAIKAMVFHTKQTRPITSTAIAIQACKDVLAETQEAIGEMKENGVTWYKQNPHAYPVGTKFYITQPTLETRIKELEARLRFQDEWLSNGVYYTTDEAFKLHDDYNTKIAELTARIEKDREYALSIKKNLERLWEIERLQELDK